MKRYCKYIDITDRNLISEATYTCLEEKYNRRDTIRMLSEYSHIQENILHDMYKIFGKRVLYPLIETIIDGIHQELINKRIVIKPIWYTVKIDGSSGKERRIGIQDIKQQIYDYIAVLGLNDMLRRIGEYQCASIKGRGQLMGAKCIERWMRNKSIRCAAKLDIKKCFESINHNKLMKWLKKYIKNNMLLYLIRKLVNTFEQGLSIGSYLSQFLCNLYMSRLYHEIHENMFHIRKHRDGTSSRVNLVKRSLFYMDDILILGSNNKHVHMAIKKIIKFAKKEMGLEIKDTWTAFTVPYKDRKYDKTFVDMMGYRAFRWHITIRRSIFKRIRRAYMRIWKYYKTHHKIPLRMAQRCMSYFGYFKHTDSCKVKKKYRVYRIKKMCRSVMRNESKIRMRTATCQNC